MLKQVTSFGRTWALYGLNMGRTALESSADRLRATAEVLGTWSTKFAAPAEQEGEVQEEKAAQASSVEATSEAGDQKPSAQPAGAPVVPEAPTSN